MVKSRLPREIVPDMGATPARDGTWAMAGNAVALFVALGTLFALCAQTGLGAGATGQEAFGALFPGFGWRDAYPLLRELAEACGSPAALNRLGALFGALAPTLLFTCMTRVVHRLLSPDLLPRAALGWALATGYAVTLAFLFSGDWLILGSGFARETWDATLLFGVVWAFARGIAAKRVCHAWGWDALFGFLLGVACAENVLFAALIVPLFIVKVVFNHARTGDCFRHLPLPTVCLALGLGTGIGLATGFSADGAVWAAYARMAGSESIRAWTHWVPRAWLTVGALHLAVPTAMAAAGLSALLGQRSVKLAFVLAVLVGWLALTTHWPAMGLTEWVPDGFAVPLPWLTATAVGHGFLLIGLATWVLRPSTDDEDAPRGGHRWVHRFGVAVGGVLAVTQLLTICHAVVRRSHYDGSLPTDIAATFLEEAGDAPLVFSASWLDPWLIAAYEGETHGPFPLSSLWARTADGRERLVETLLAAPATQDADPARLRRLTAAPWPLFQEDLLATHANIRDAARFMDCGMPLFRARLLETPQGLWSRAREEDAPPPDWAAAETRLKAFEQRFGARLRRTRQAGETRLDSPFRQAACRYLSRQATVLGAAWEDAGHPTEAFRLYLTALRWDAGNGIALLNAYGLVRADADLPPSKCATIDRRVQAFAEACRLGRIPRTSLEEQIEAYGPLRNYAVLASLPGIFETTGGEEAFAALLTRARGLPSVRLLTARAALHMSRGETACAETCLREAMRLSQGADEIRLALAYLLRLKGQAEEALELLEPVVTHEAWGERAASLAALGRWAEARTAALQALKATPDDPAAATLLALAAVHLDGAVPADLRHRLRQSPYHEALVRSTLAERAGNMPEALHWAREAWARNPRMDGLRERMAMLALRTGAWGEAEGEALALLRHDPTNRVALLVLGLARQRVGAFDQAERYLGQLIALGGTTHPIALVAQSGNLLRAGKTAEAAELAERAADADPNSLPTAVALTVTRARSGHGDCREALARVHALDPGRDVPQTVFAEGWVAVVTDDLAARAAARKRLQATRAILAADPEGRADVEALEAALAK